jgi:hypothetical protein
MRAGFCPEGKPMNTKQAFVVGCLIGTAALADQAFAGDLPSNFPNLACGGPDSGEVTTIVTVPANESVDVFHYRAGSIASIIEFCIRDAGSEWTLVASHGTDQNQWSLLQSWTYPKAVQIKTRAYANGTLYPFKSQTRTRTAYGYSFSWFDSDPNDQNDQIVYCYSARTGCPASRRVDFP